MAQNSNRHWTSEDDRRFRELLASNTSFRNIAMELGRDLAAVKERAQRLRLAPGRARSPRSSSQDTRRAKRFWTEQEIGTLREMSTTHSIEQIAEQLSRSANSVRLKAFWLNLPLRRA
jgi:IS30 family transposase